MMYGSLSQPEKLNISLKKIFVFLKFRKYFQGKILKEKFNNEGTI